MKADARLTHRLQREIKISEGKYEHLFESAGDAIFILDPRNLQILEANRAAQTLTGYSQDELIRFRFVNLCSIFRDKEKEVMDNPSEVQNIFAAYENTHLNRKDTSLVLIEGFASVASHSEGPVVQVFLREVTERRRLEQQLRQAEKLSALGQLISGVAHELNNPLAVISGYAQLLTMRTGLDQKTHENLLKIQRESERASKIVQNFLTFARKHPMEKANVNFNELLAISLELLDYDLRASGVRLVREFQAELPFVFADPNQLEQVFLNLINNAIHAMEGSPREKELKIRTESSHGLVRVIVIDTGSGIPLSVLNKIFDPFFTTKEGRVGTGLGLSISYNIVKEHLGTITARNNPEGGATFTLELPVSHVKSMQKDVLSPEQAKSLKSRRHYKVLVVDDETAILDVFAELLLDYSCRVHGVTNGLHALEYLQDHDVDLILCDLKMPGMDGKRFFEEIKKSRPEMVKKIIFVTGDTNSPRTTEFLKNSGARWFPKPFNFREIEALLVDHFQRIEKMEGGPVRSESLFRS